MEEKNNKYSQQLKIDLGATSSTIEAFIQSMLDNLKRDGAVIAVSGGLDSAITATLTVRSLGAHRVHLLNMPERDSQPIHQNHARILAKHLETCITVRHISPVLRATGTYRLLHLRFLPTLQLRSALVDFAKKHLNIDNANLLATRLQPGNATLVAKGAAYVVAKHRIRMVTLYQYAEVHNLMVVGAANRTEWLTGTFSKWGVDHCADVMPLLHLYRSQLERIAEYVGVPDVIRNKVADPDVMPGVNDKGALLGDFTLVDQILYGIENGQDKSQLSEIYGKNNVEHILHLYELSQHMRESPYHLNLGPQ
jgi:NAD+ synthase